MILLIDSDSTHMAKVCDLLSKDTIELHSTDTVWETARLISLYSFDLIAINGATESIHLLLPTLFDLRKIKNTMLLVYPIVNANDRATFLSRGFDMCLSDDDPAECAAAIKSLLRRPQIDAFSESEKLPGYIVHKELTLDPLRQRVTMRGEIVELTTLEFKILYLLASNPGIIFSRERIYDRLWDGEPSYDAMSVVSYVSAIRKKLGLSAKDKEYLETVNGAGYRFAERDK